MIYILTVFFISLIIIFCISLCKAASKEDIFFSELSRNDDEK